MFERALLAGVWTAREPAEALLRVRELVGAGDFVAPEHARLWDEFVLAEASALPMDPATLTERIAQRPGGAQAVFEPFGGIAYLVELSAESAGAPSASIEWYAREIRRMALIRRVRSRLEGGLDRLDRLSEDEHPREVVDELAGDLLSSVVEGPSDCETLADLVRRRRPQIEAAYLRPPDQAITVGESTTLGGLDALSQGLPIGEVTLIGARPGMGKTALALQMVFSFARRTGRPALMFNLEMRPGTLVDRLAAGMSGLSLVDIRKGSFGPEQWEAYNAAVDRIAATPLHVVSRTSLTVHDIAAEARRVRMRHGDLGMVVVDYMQLITPTSARGSSREREVAEISRAAVALSGDLACPVVILAQLSRATEARLSKRPELADLRESGALEQDASLVLLMFRPAYYWPERATRYQLDAGYQQIEVMVAKNRNGATGSVDLAWHAANQRFRDLNLREVELLARRQSGDERGAA